MYRNSGTVNFRRYNWVGYDSGHVGCCYPLLPKYPNLTINSIGQYNRYSGCSALGSLNPTLTFSTNNKSTVSLTISQILVRHMILESMISLICGRTNQTALYQHVIIPIKMRNCFYSGTLL